MMNGTRHLWQKYGVVVLVLAFLAVLTYGASAATPSLLGDEWGILKAYLTDRGPQCPDWQTPRPFGVCWLWMIHRIVRSNYHWYHAAGILVSIMSACLLFVFLEHLWPGRIDFNAAVAALYLVFPADVTRTWLAGNIVWAVTLFLGAACFLAAFWRRGRWWAWGAGMLFLFFALGTYEVSVGVAVLLSLGAFIWARNRTWLHRLALLAPALLAVSFSIWRWSFQVSVGTAYGHSVDEVSFSPAVLISRLIFGYRVNLQYAWTETLLDLLPPLQVGPRLGQGLAIVAIGSAVLTAAAVSVLAMRVRRSSTNDSEASSATRRVCQSYAQIAVAGLAILGAGYFPIIIAVFPGMDYTVTRVHHLSSIGAAMFICALIFCFSGVLIRDPHRRQRAAWGALMPLLVLGVASQLLVQQRVNRVWEEQKWIWHSMFELAPDIADDTNVVFVLSGYEADQQGPYPFITGTWSVRSALRILYGKDALLGYYAVGNPEEVLSYRNGELTVWYHHHRYVLPVIDTIVFVFDRASQRLSRLETLVVGTNAVPLGANRVLPVPSSRSDYRWLVRD